MPSGSVIQTITKETTGEETTTQNTPQDTALTLSITPTTANSKIFVIASFNAGGTSSSSAVIPSLFRGSTEITTLGGIYMATNAAIYGGHCLSILDSPNTASQVTYTVKFKLNSSSQTVLFNTNYGGNSSGEKAHLTLMEIAG
jgi:hypothetical protein